MTIKLRYVPQSRMAIQRVSQTRLVAKVLPRVASHFVLSIPISGKPSNAEGIECFLFVDPVTFPAGFTGSLAKAGVAATASTVFSILVDEVQVGTVTFALGATTGTFAMATDLAVLTGQQLDLLCPATADATLEDIKITLRGTI